MKEMLKELGYSDKAIEYYINKVNVGIIENPDVAYAYTGSCGDTFKIYLKIESEVIKEAKFQATGCAGPFTSGSALTQIIKNKTIGQAKQISERDILEHLQDVPASKHHCMSLTIKTLTEALKSYK